MIKDSKFWVTGMSCAACERHVRDAVLKLNGVEEVNVNLLSNSMNVKYNPETVTEVQIVAAVKNAGYGAELNTPDGENSESNTGKNFPPGLRGEWNKRQQLAAEAVASMKFRLISSVILLVPLMYISMGSMFDFPFSDLGGNVILSVILQFILTTVVIVINKHFFISGFRALFQKNPNMDTLVSIGALAAYLYGIWVIILIMTAMYTGDAAAIHKYSHSLYLESAATILTLVTVGKYLETVSKNKTSDILGRLIDLSPKTAIVIEKGEEKIIPAEEIKIGDIVLIKPGQIIPADGVIIEGTGYIDEAVITGESVPVEKSAGDEVISVTVNKNGSFKFKAQKVGESTAFAKIIRLVDEAGATKAPIARIADKVSGVFVPVVIFIAVMTAVIWLLLGQTFEFALNCAVSVLVISCPCALGLATPVAIMAGIGKAAEHGILIKSAEILEALHSIDTVALDKTGTITLGEPVVCDVIPAENVDKNVFLSLAAAVESNSEHPLASAVVEYTRENNIEFTPAAAIEITSGMGISAIIDNKRYFAGKKDYILKNGVLTEEIPADLEEKYSKDAKTLIWVSDGQTLLGLITLTDGIRETSKSSIEEFHKLGLRTVLLTGDNKSTADAVCKTVGIGECYSGLLPQDKDRIIQQLKNSGHKVMMIGDGVNDAPALVRADIGAAIGAGTDVAIESADIILMKNSLSDAVFAITLSNAVIRNIKENLFWAFFYNILGIPIAAGVLFPAFGVTLTPMIAAAAMSFSSVSVVLNALRLRFFSNKIITETGEHGKMKTIELKIEGMMCAHCQSRVQKALEAVDGVERVIVNLENKTAVIEGDETVNPEILMSAVKDDGYDPVSYKML